MLEHSVLETHLHEPIVINSTTILLQNQSNPTGILEIAFLSIMF